MLVVACLLGGHNKRLEETGLYGTSRFAILANCYVNQVMGDDASVTCDMHERIAGFGWDI